MGNSFYFPTPCIALPHALPSRQLLSKAPSFDLSLLMLSLSPLSSTISPLFLLLLLLPSDFFFWSRQIQENWEVPKETAGGDSASRASFQGYAAFTFFKLTFTFSNSKLLSLLLSLHQEPHVKDHQSFQFVKIKTLESLLNTFCPNQTNLNYQQDKNGIGLKFSLQCFIVL